MSGLTRPKALIIAGALLAALVAVVGTVLFPRSHQPPRVTLPLRKTGEVTLPGDSSRYDYESLDQARGLLFIAHLGASQIVEVDIRTERVVRTIGGLANVHGVLAVPALHRVYATVTGSNLMAALDEDTGQILTRTPTGDYPDGLAYDPRRRAVWVTNESGGSETVIDAVTGSLRGTVPLGGEAGNVAYDPIADQILVDVQNRDTLAVIDAAHLAVTRRVPLPGCDHDHGLTLDPAARIAFIACDGNARLLTLTLTAWKVTSTNPVGSDPDVLAYDRAAHRLYVAAESGWVTTLDIHGATATVSGRAHLADGAHVVAVDPATHYSYYPIPHAIGQRPALEIYQPK